MILANVLYVGKGCWTIHVSGGRRTAQRTVEGGAVVVDAARAMGATHLRWRDVYAADGSIYRDPFPVVRELCAPEEPVAL